MMQCRTIQFPFCRGMLKYRPAKFYFSGHFIMQPLNRYKTNFKEKALKLFQPVKSQYFIFEILAFFCGEIKYFNINYNEKRLNLNYGLFKR